MASLFLEIAVCPVPQLWFKELDFSTIKPDKVILMVNALGIHPTKGKIWKMTKTNKVAGTPLNHDMSLKENMVVDGELLSLVEVLLPES